VDRHAPRYLPGVFGPGRYAVLQHPERLPVVLVDILRRLVRS
jgi:nitric oxide reductase NorD protein